MSTRSLIRFHFHEMKDDQPFALLYRHWDGHPEIGGKELADFLGPYTVGNGIGNDPKPYANGMGCLAAQVVAHFKAEPGGFYLHAPDTSDIGEEYVYDVYPISMETDAAAFRAYQRVGLTVHDGKATGPVLYDGAAADFTPEACDAARS